jgi:predicted permease
MVLLLCSALFLRSLSSAQSVETGMSAQEVLLLAVDPSLQQYDEAKSRRFFVDLLDRVRALSGVQAAAITQAVPLSLGGSSSIFQLPGSSKEISTDIFAITPGYFATLGISVRQGADFTGGAGDANAVVLNEQAAVAAFGEANVVGRMIQFDGQTRRIAAVVANAKSRTLGEEPRSILYRPLYENQMRDDSFLGYTLAVRTNGDAATHTAAVRRQIQALDPTLAIFDVRTWRAHREKALFLPRLAALMFGLCGAVALILSTIGLYGVVSFSVAQRTREIGIRMALGAERNHVLGWVLRAGLALAGAGIAIGLAAALGVSRVTASLLYGVSPTDVLTFTAVPVFLLAVVMVACWIPARRAAALDPASTLRAD